MQLHNYVLQKLIFSLLKGISQIRFCYISTGYVLGFGGIADVSNMVTDMYY